MDRKKQRVLVIGGTGFLGQPICLEFKKRGHEIDALGLSVDKVTDDFRRVIKVIKKDIDASSDNELVDLFKNYQQIIYALGPDDRVDLPAGVKAAEFYHQNLAKRTERVANLAKQANVARMIILGSYFTYFDEASGGKLAKRHPYIAARRSQWRLVKNTGIDAVLLGIPYVFGVTKPLTPIWRKVFIDSFANSPYIFYGQGGTAITSHQKVAVAVAQAAKHVKSGDYLLIGSQNIVFKELLPKILKAAAVKKPLRIPPAWLFSIILKFKWLGDKLSRKSSGLDYWFLNQDILSKNFYIDYQATDRYLQMADYEDNLEEAITETGRAIK